MIIVIITWIFFYAFARRTLRLIWTTLTSRCFSCHFRIGADAVLLIVNIDFLTFIGIFKSWLDVHLSKYIVTANIYKIYIVTLVLVDIL